MNYWVIDSVQPGATNQLIFVGEQEIQVSSTAIYLLYKLVIMISRVVHAHKNLYTIDCPCHVNYIRQTIPYIE